ncbi:MAG: T9SS type A sorting domain-containing protein [Bacteroidales bacterium]|nr:T9SS type A sorting domain-containing protein [Bacteroidales bacterium]
MRTNFGILLFSFLFFQVIIQAQPVLISGGPDNDIIGRICRLPDSRLIAMIERNPDWGSGDLFISISWDSGYSWSGLEPVVVKAGNQSTHSVVVTPDDSIRSYYASDETGTYKIRTISSIDGINWVNDHQIDLGWDADQDVYDPDVIVEGDGSMIMTYVRMGSGGYVSYCSETNQWDQNKTLVQSGAYRIRICRHPFYGYLAAYHRNMGNNQYDVNVKTSTDLINWSDETTITNSGNSHDPCCGCIDIEYWLYYATYKNGAYNLYRKSSTDGLNWSFEEQITFDNTHNTQPAFTLDLYTKTIGLNLVWTHAIDYDTDNDIYFERYIYTEVIEQQRDEDHIRIIQSIENTFQFTLPNRLTGKFDLFVYDLQGRIIENKKITVVAGLSQVALNFIKTGVYLFHVVANGDKFTEKIYVQ